MTQKTFTTWALAALCSFGCGAAAVAQDSSALLDALVRKKVLTSQEAEDVRADLIKDNAQTNAGKLQLSNSVTSLKLYGDIRLRYQHDNKQYEYSEVGHDNQRSRERVRLRLGADFTLVNGFFGGVGLQTAQAADSGNQTVNDPGDKSAGFGNYNIYISKAYFGWANDYFTIIGGKQANPFYTTDLVWDADINPVGAVEKIDIIKGIGALTHNGDIREESRYGLSLVAGQFAYSDNTENNFDNDASSDVWLFAAQLIGSAKLTPDVKVTFAPGYMTYTAGNIQDVNNETAFMTGKTSTSGTTVGTVTTVLTDGASRDISVITAPGDISFTLCGIKTKVLWDFAYNTKGTDRAQNVYGINGTGLVKVNGVNRPVASHSSRDDIAWLAGIQLGQNKKAGDWSILANFRQTGVSSVDPNLNDSDFALGQLNMQGIKVGAAYNLTDACVAGITYYDAWNLRSDLNAAQTTAGQKIASVNSVQIVQVDLNIKF